VRYQAHRLLLWLFRLLPRPVRRLLIRGVWPKYTAGSICLVERDDGSVLLVRHVYRGRWGAPGGLLSRREQPIDGVRREVREEVGIDVELIGEPAVVVDPKVQRIDFVYRGRPVDAAAVAHPASPEIAEVRWFPRDALPELQRELTEALVAMARVSNAPIVRPARGVAPASGQRPDPEAISRG